MIGADGSSGVTARHVGVRYRQVDLGLELEVAVPPAEQERWRGRLLLDWGAMPGSYGWVFPKGDRLTVGVIAARGAGEGTRDYLRRFVDRLGLTGLPAEHDSGHLTRCREEDSPLRNGRVLVAGDAAGLLEPWSREGISFALRSGELAGAAVAAGELAGYERAVGERLVPSMRAGYRLLDLFIRRPGCSTPCWRRRPGSGCSCGSVRAGRASTRCWNAGRSGRRSRCWTGCPVLAGRLCQRRPAPDSAAACS
ncbi:hypothetical protein GCM10027614_10920 [Micromonospora vulcania]